MNSKPNEPIPQYLLRCLKIGSATWNHCIVFHTHKHTLGGVVVGWSSFMCGVVIGWHCDWVVQRLGGVVIGWCRGWGCSGWVVQWFGGVVVGWCSGQRAGLALLEVERVGVQIPPGQKFGSIFAPPVPPANSAAMSAQTVHCRWEDENARERAGRSPSLCRGSGNKIINF